MVGNTVGEKFGDWGGADVGSLELGEAVGDADGDADGDPVGE